MQRTTRVRPLFVGFAACLLLAGESLAQGTRSAECVRPVARQRAAGATVMLPDTKKLPCRLLVVETPVALRSDAEGTVSDIQGSVVRAPDGRFFSSTGRGQVTVWNADGSFAKNIGRAGSGPGEFRQGAMSIHAGPRGSVFVRDNNLRWSVFSPALEFERTLSAASMGFGGDYTAFLDDGTYLSATPVTSRPESFFHVYDFGKPASTGGGPLLVRSFGDVSADERVLPSSSRERRIAYAGGATFWAGSPTGAGRGYELELWGTDGTRKMTLRRDVAWYPNGLDRAAAARDGTPTARPPAQVTLLHTDGNGLVFVGLWVPKGKWGDLSATPPKDRAAAMDAMAALYIEVIDANAGIVLASTGALPRSRVISEFALGLFSKTRLGYRPMNTPDDLPAMRIVEFKLVAQ